MGTHSEPSRRTGKGTPHRSGRPPGRSVPMPTAGRAPTPGGQVARLGAKAVRGGRPALALAHHWRARRCPPTEGPPAMRWRPGRPVPPRPRRRSLIMAIRPRWPGTAACERLRHRRRAQTDLVDVGAPMPSTLLTVPLLAAVVAVPAVRGAPPAHAAGGLQWSLCKDVARDWPADDQCTELHDGPGPGRLRPTGRPEDQHRGEPDQGNRPGSLARAWCWSILAAPAGRERAFRSTSAGAPSAESARTTT
jgi:hypothetical protein